MSWVALACLHWTWLFSTSLHTQRVAAKPGRRKLFNVLFPTNSLVALFLIPLG